MAEDKHKKTDHGHHHHHAPSNEPLDVSEFDAGQKALANALKVSFSLLKLIMVVLVVAYFASGFYTIEPDWQGLVLRFGKITGQGESRVKNPGAGWRWPAPVDEVFRLPVKMQQSIEMGSEFWHSGGERYRNTLAPEMDGYVLTRNEPIAGVDGSDYNILHCRWEIKYHIGDIEKFFRNFYVEELKTGQDFYDIKNITVEPTIKAFASDAIVSTLVHYSVDEALTVSKSAIAGDIKKELVKKLETIDSGISIDSVLLTSITWPKQVDNAFLESTKAKLESDTQIINARKYFNDVISEAGGRNAELIVENLEDPELSEKEILMLWDNIAGKAKDVITEAQTYRSRTIQSARANAIYLEKLLPEYRKRPDLVLQKLYQDSIEEVLENAQEKMFIYPKTGDAPREIRLMVSRDSSARKDKKQQEGQQQ